MGCKEKPVTTLSLQAVGEEKLWLYAWITSSPSFFTDLGAYRVVSLSYSHSSIPASDGCIFLFLKYATTEVLMLFSDGLSFT